MASDRRSYLLGNIFIPLLIGGVIYYIFAPNVIFVKTINPFLGIRHPFSIIAPHNYVWQFIRYYLLDMLWSYSLVISLFFMQSNDCVSIGKVFLIACVFSLLLETLQLLSTSWGTFDWLDIVFEILAEGIAVIVLKNYIFRKEKK